MTLLDGAPEEERLMALAAAAHAESGEGGDIVHVDAIGPFTPTPQKPRRLGRWVRNVRLGHTQVDPNTYRYLMRLGALGLQHTKVVVRSEAEVRERKEKEEQARRETEAQD
ncbi:hypothetical protein [Streptomyces sp. NPDC057557]|uniref:hypothetical protein n=1 Tax=Streptomyces sp. NPDC057557 TaxID=3346167 RepID=UPI0036A828A6